MQNRKVWYSALLACLMAGGVTGAQDGRFVHVESDDILDTTGGTLEITWTVPEDPDDESLVCKQTSNSKKNSGLGNNCSFCLSEDGNSLESCKCDGNNKNHDDCILSIESGSGEWDAYQEGYNEMIYRVLRANGIDPGADLAAGDLATIEVQSGRRLSRQHWSRVNAEEGSP